MRCSLASGRSTRTRRTRASPTAARSRRWPLPASCRSTSSAPASARPSIGSISQSAMGGSLPGGTTLRVALCALDSNGLPSTPSNIAIVTTAAGTSTNQIVLPGITWPAVAGLARYAVFVATQDDLICAAGRRAHGGRGEHLYARLDHLRRPSGALHLGAALALRFEDPGQGEAHRPQRGRSASPWTTSPRPNQIVCYVLIEPDPTTFNPVGRILSVIGRPESSTPFLSFDDHRLRAAQPARSP